jgi:hypothetical protein
MRDNMTALKAAQTSPLTATMSLLSLVGERYLAIEGKESDKMAIEVTTSWNCRPVVN